MLSEGGVGPWKLDQDRASACLYVVAVRNVNGETDEDMRANAVVRLGQNIHALFKRNKS